jgi:hypothetical protein
MLQTALSRPEADQALLGSFDFTPVFATEPQQTGASVFPEAPRALPMDWGAIRALAAATAVTTRRQLAEHLAAVSSAINQTIAEVGEQIWVLVRAEPSDVIGDMRNWMPTPDLPATPSPAQFALAAVSDIQRWLAVGQDQVAALAGYAPRSVKNWREGMDPYPATVRRLFDLHALLGSLTQSMGTEGVRLWLADAGSAGVSRRERLADDAGLRSVISEATTTLFEAPTVTPVHALDFDEEAERGVAPRPDAFSGPVRRVRRRS